MLEAHKCIGCGHTINDMVAIMTLLTLHISIFNVYLSHFVIIAGEGTYGNGVLTSVYSNKPRTYFPFYIHWS